MSCAQEQLAEPTFRSRPSPSPWAAPSAWAPAGSARPAGRQPGPSSEGGAPAAFLSAFGPADVLIAVGRSFPDLGGPWAQTSLFVFSIQKIENMTEEKKRKEMPTSYEYA